MSNTNMHLRAGVGRVTRVLVPCPAEGCALVERALSSARYGVYSLQAAIAAVHAEAADEAQAFPCDW